LIYCIGASIKETKKEKEKKKQRKMPVSKVATY
jgi:hypothetical protein